MYPDFFGMFSKNTQISFQMKIRAVGAELFLEDGHGEANSLLSQFSNAPKNRTVSLFGDGINTPRFWGTLAVGLMWSRSSHFTRFVRRTDISKWRRC
jgi:hypothetical protein